MNILSDGENRMIVALFVSTQYQRVTEDGRTDGQTDTPVANTAVSISEAMPTRCKNKNSKIKHRINDKIKAVILDLFTDTSLLSNINFVILPFSMY